MKNINSMKKYQIIYADPPWVYWCGGKKNASKHYICMKDKDIYKLPVKNLADKNCALFLWATFPKLPEALKTLKEWGFKYSTVVFVWIKSKKRTEINQSSFFPEDNIDTFFGLGYWTRANAEIVLLGTIGKPKRIMKNIKQIIYEPIRKHSQKPDVVRDRIIQLLGDLPRIELFARQKTEKWDAWGNEIESDIEL